jgi:tRNA U34 5-methylaminomethyl-2-thiouridine-forming methyltransferase MnmC
MKYEKRRSADGSWTLYSKEFDECYHSLKDGALKEALHKHVIPAFTFVSKEHLRILDICFGLGINTLATLYYLHKGSHPVRSVEIFSPEFDEELLRQLPTFSYPKELEPYKEIVKHLIEDKVFKSDNIHIELFVGDAREYVKRLRDIDVVYQDAFSPKKNPLLWTLEYFEDIAKLLTKDGVLTTYSVATPVRLALHRVGLRVYEWEAQGVRRSTVASFSELPLKEVDMEAKAGRSTANVLRDKDFEKG